MVVRISIPLRAFTIKDQVIVLSKCGGFCTHYHNILTHKTLFLGLPQRGCSDPIGHQSKKGLFNLNKKDKNIFYVTSQIIFFHTNKQWQTEGAVCSKHLRLNEINILYLQRCVQVCSMHTSMKCKYNFEDYSQIHSVFQPNPFIPV